MNICPVPESVDLARVVQITEACRVEELTWLGCKAFSSIYVPLPSLGDGRKRNQEYPAMNRITLVFE